MVGAGKPATQLVPLLEALLRHGANVDAADEQGTTALHQAAKSSPCAVVEALLAHHGTTNQQDKVLTPAPSPPPHTHTPPCMHPNLLLALQAAFDQQDKVQNQPFSPFSFIYFSL